MITPSQSLSSTAIAPGKGTGPYAGPERRVADRRNANDAASRAGGYHELGPYLPERGRSNQRTAATSTPTYVPAAVAPSPVSDAATFEVLDEEFIMAEAILAEPALLEVPRAAIELPWITAFLDDVAEGAVAAATDAVASSSETAAIEAELWPLDDAGSRMRELASALESHTASHDESIGHATNAHSHNRASVARLRMWNDDDFVDVMPVHVPSLPADAVTSQAPAPATRDSAGAHESAALALEALARRVRRGEVDFPAFDAELGDAAALATALVVLLAPRS